MSLQYRRVLIKISGEALSGGTGKAYDYDFVSSVCRSIQRCLSEGAEIGIVIGGGNFWRGVKDGAGHIERVSADRMGMLATAINCLAVADVFRQTGVNVKIMTAVDIQGIGERHDVKKALEYLESGCVVLFGCGTGHPFFSTDTAAVLRAAEIQADAILLAKNVDGVYTADPKKDPNAQRIDDILFSEVLEKRLQVMDATATSLAMENNLPVIVFALADPENIHRVLNGEKIGSYVH